MGRGGAYAKLSRKAKQVRSAGAWAATFTPIGGGGEVPDDAVLHYSFAQGTYWTEADGDLTEAEVISSGTSIEPGVGYTGEAGVRLLSPALPYLTVDKTVVLRGRVIMEDVEADNDFFGHLLVAPESEDYEEVLDWVVHAAFTADPQSITLSAQVAADDSGPNKVLVNTTPSDADANVEVRFDFAATLTTTTGAASALGGTVATDTGAVTLAARAFIDMWAPGGQPLSPSIAFESITVYPAQLDAALPALSTPIT